ncbi:hypothetical protein [Streptomyces sp. NPDC029554]|uniref:hypothetical protein n=1 Tax=Streptomyces sp. NPDC029554 TaxID=3155126 RepID=UPI00340649AE
MTRRQRAAQRLTTGAAALASRFWDRACAWCARGRRDDLTGWRAALGPILRATGLLVAALIACLIVRRRPWLLWVLSGWWLAVSWRAGKAAPRAAEAASEQPQRVAPEEVRQATLEWIRQQIGDRQGVHLRDLLQHAHAHGMFEGLEVTDFRAHLERWEIPVRNRVRVRGLGVTVGIHRDDLTAPSTPSPTPEPQEAAEAELHAP